MDLQVLERVWWVLALLGYLQVSVMLTVLARYREHAVTVHDRVRESKLLRRAYVQARAQQAGGEEDGDEVFETTIIEPGAPRQPMSAAA